MKKPFTNKELIQHLMMLDMDLPVYFSDSNGEHHPITESEVYEYSVGTYYPKIIIEL